MWRSINIKGRGPGLCGRFQGEDIEKHCAFEIRTREKPRIGGEY